MLSEAKFKIQKDENQASLTEDHNRDLKSKIECQEMDVKRAMEWYAYSKRGKNYFTKNWQIVNKLYDKPYERNSRSGSIEESSRVTC